jgi:CubicO group peptidase (beta-lactamase class C family)
VHAIISISFVLLRYGLGCAVFAMSSLTFAQRTDVSDTRETIEALPPNLDAFVEAQMKAWHVPGLALAVVTKDRVLLTKGYGVADVDTGRRVGSRTVFPIASLTKSFTAASLLVLAREGKLDLDKPVREYLPDFQMHDPYATQTLTTRDLLSHRSGLPRHEYVWFGTQYSRDNLYKKLRFLEPAAQPRTEFQYQNLMFMTAGYLGGRVAGVEWETLVKQKILTPLGMVRANFTLHELRADADHATGYAKPANQDVVKVDYDALDAMGPTGSINATIDDMAAYAQMYLGKTGSPLHASDVAQMSRPHTAIAELSPFAERGITNYGLGLFVSSYRGHRYAFHGGNLTGASTYYAFFPERGFAVVALSNMTNSLLPNVVAFRIFDHMINKPAVDWSERLLAYEEKTRDDNARAKTHNVTQQRASTHPSHSLDEYVGEYLHPGYGVAVVVSNRGALELRFNGAATPINHLHFDVFEAPTDPLNRLGRFKVMFHTDWSGEIAALSIPFEPRLPDIRFVKQGNPDMRQQSFLLPFAGTYELRGNDVSVDVRGDLLIVSMPGQPPYELEGVRGTLFRIKGLSGYRVEFVRGAASDSGVIDQMTVFQPNGTYVAERKRQ